MNVLGEKLMVILILISYNYVIEVIEGDNLKLVINNKFRLLLIISTNKIVKNKASHCFVSIWMCGGVNF